MLLDIFVTIPCLMMTTIAWYIRVGIALTCLIVLFAVAIGAIGFYRVRAGSRPVPQDHWPEPVLQGPFIPQAVKTLGPASAGHR
jgi:hypothetical protein